MKGDDTMTQAQIEPYYEKKIECALCKQNYTTQKLRSRFAKVKKIHSDFYTEYKDKEYVPFYYEVHVCPYCGYAETESYSKTFPPDTEQKIIDTLKNWQYKDYGKLRTLMDAIQTYKLALLSASLKQEKHIIIAGLCTRLAWLYRMENNDQDEQRFLHLALNAYIKSYEQSDYLETQMSEMKLLYIIGELYLRTHDYKKAVLYFSKVTSHEQKHYEPKIERMARDQWQVARDASKNAEASMN